MTKHELWHLHLMHTSYSKLHAASRLNLPGMPVLSEHEYSIPVPPVKMLMRAVIPGLDRLITTLVSWHLTCLI